MRPLNIHPLSPFDKIMPASGPAYCYDADQTCRSIQAARSYMREAEGQYVRESGGRPRPILTREERDFIRQNRDAPVDE